MIDYAIIGGGIGGCESAALLHREGYDVHLFEKNSSLGGCASNFTHRGITYQSGATTLSGYHEGGSVQRVCERIGVKLDLISHDPAMIVIDQKRRIPRYQDRDRFVQSLDQTYPHPRHRAFWELVHHLCDAFYAHEEYTYSNRSWGSKWDSLKTFLPLFKHFFPYYRTKALDFITTFYGEISLPYRRFLEAQTLIVTQAPLERVPFISAALALGYSFYPTHSIRGGMGHALENITYHMDHIHLNTPITELIRLGDRWLVQSAHESIEARKIVLGSAIYDHQSLFDRTLKPYFDRYKKLNNYQSAFVLYAHIRTDEKLHPHYQILTSTHLPWSRSESLFVSLMRSDDHHYSLSASLHTDVRFWESATYLARKQALECAMLQLIRETLLIPHEAFLHHFSATPRTFLRYLNRSQLGGNPMDRHFFTLPANDTPIEGLYHVGDSTFPAQGWPGVSMGVLNLMRLIDAGY